MSPKITSLKKAGLTALGLFGLAAFCVADPGDTAPSRQVSSPASSPSSAVLLLSDGRMLQGTVLETELGYSLKWKGGTIPIRKSQVEKMAATIDEIYKYKVEQLPDRDPDEQLKLAKWCLTNKLNRQAKTHLQAILAMSKGDAEVEAMLTMVQSEEDRATYRDSAVMQTKAEVVEPGEMPTLPIKQARGLAAPSLPRIFDLPAALAVKRADEFDRRIHPLLQKHCAQCHNEQYDGLFQLIQIKSKRDWTLEVFRVNLDATLRLVDREDPSKSELLASALRPHGPKNQSVFVGSNDPAYRYLANWVQSIRSPQADPGKLGSKLALEGGSSGESFAADRAGGRGPNAVGAMPSQNSGRPRQAVGAAGQQPPLRNLGGGIVIFDETPPSDAEFPRSPLIDGRRPAQFARQVPTAPEGLAPSEVPAERPTPRATPAAPATPGAPPKPAANDAAKPPTKPVKIDPALLEKTLKNRYSPK